MTVPASVRIVATGSCWAGRGVSSIYTVTEDLVARARSEIHATTYALGQEAVSILDRLEEKARESVEVLLIVNRFESQPRPLVDRLRELQQKYPTFDLYSFGTKQKGAELHAKLLVVDRREALVTSSNLSWHGLVGNHELGILLQGSSASKIARLIDKLANSDFVRSVAGGQDEQLHRP